MIITLCGSARFEGLFHLWNEILTLSEHTVYGLSVYPSSKTGKKNWYSLEDKIALDAAHRRKIAASDAIFVINRMAYLGESTLSEIEYARSLGKKMFALESWGKGNGVGCNHFKSVQEIARKYGVLGIGSPIDTFWDHFSDPWSLLPEVGRRRNELVDRVRAFEKVEAKTIQTQPSRTQEDQDA